MLNSIEGILAQCCELRKLFNSTERNKDDLIVLKNCKKKYFYF